MEQDDSSTKKEILTLLMKFLGFGIGLFTFPTQIQQAHVEGDCNVAQLFASYLNHVPCFLCSLFIVNLRDLNQVKQLFLSSLISPSRHSILVKLKMELLRRFTHHQSMSTSAGLRQRFYFYSMEMIFRNGTS